MGLLISESKNWWQLDLESVETQPGIMKAGKLKLSAAIQSQPRAFD